MSCPKFKAIIFKYSLGLYPELDCSSLNNVFVCKVRLRPFHLVLLQQLLQPRKGFFNDGKKTHSTLTSCTGCIASAIQVLCEHPTLVQISLYFLYLND